MIVKFIEIKVEMALHPKNRERRGEKMARENNKRPKVS